MQEQKILVALLDEKELTSLRDKVDRGGYGNKIISSCFISRQEITAGHGTKVADA